MLADPCHLRATRAVRDPIIDVVLDCEVPTDLLDAEGVVLVRVGDEERVDRVVELGPAREDSLEVVHQLIDVVGVLGTGIDEDAPAGKLEKRRRALADIYEVGSHVRRRAGGGQCGGLRQRHGGRGCGP